MARLGALTSQLRYWEWTHKPQPWVLKADFSPSKSGGTGEEHAFQTQTQFWHLGRSRQFGSLTSTYFRERWRQKAWKGKPNQATLCRDQHWYCADDHIGSIPRRQSKTSLSQRAPFLKCFACRREPPPPPKWRIKCRAPLPSPPSSLTMAPLFSFLVSHPTPRPQGKNLWWKRILGGKWVCTIGPERLVYASDPENEKMEGF